MLKKWKTFAALILMFFAIVFNWSWFWIIFLLLGFINILKTGTIHFVEEVSKKETPKLYWIMIVVWALLIFYSVYDYIIDNPDSLEFLT